MSRRYDLECAEWDRMWTRAFRRRNVGGRERRGGGGSGASLPLEGMIAGYEFSPLYVTFGAGSEIATVADLSGNGNTITAVGAGGSRPTAAPSASYGNQYVLTATGTPGLARATWTQGSQSQPISIIWGGESADINATVWDVGAGNFSGPYCHHSVVTALTVGAGGAEHTGGARTRAVHLHVFQVDAAGTDSSYRDNLTTPVASADGGDTAMQGVSLGNHTIIGDFQGVFSFFYVYAGTLAGTAKAAQVAAYVNAKFAHTATV